jgi:hypothetical protein
LCSGDLTTKPFTNSVSVRYISLLVAKGRLILK